MKKYALYLYIPVDTALTEYGLRLLLFSYFGTIIKSINDLIKALVT